MYLPNRYSSAYVIPAIVKYVPAESGFSSLSEPEKVDKIISIISTYLGREREAYKLKRRYRELVYYKQLLAYFLKRYTKLTVIEVGNMFNQDHSTISHHTHTISNDVEGKHASQVKNDVEAITQLIFE